MPPELIQELARHCGFELAGVAPAVPLEEAGYYRQWVASGYAGEMGYLTGRRAEVRNDPRNLLASAKSVICVGKVYNGPEPYSTRLNETELAWISRYAWGKDYHDVLRSGLERLVEKIRKHATEPLEWKICVDTAPLLERAYARRAGLGWIGKNTCLINQQMGSWFFLGELLVSLEIEPGSPPPDRCGTCTRCIDACPTAAIVPTGRFQGPEWAIDSRLCIAYFTIELRGPIPTDARARMGNHVFGCDICQDVCPWNVRFARATSDPAFTPRPETAHPDLVQLQHIPSTTFESRYGETAFERPGMEGMRRNAQAVLDNIRARS